MSFDAGLAICMQELIKSKNPKRTDNVNKTKSEGTAEFVTCGF